MNSVVYFSQVRRLAASSRPIDEVLVDAVRRWRTAPHKPADGGREKPGQREFSFEDEEDADETIAADDGLILPADQIAAAVLLGRALERNREALGKLQNRDAFAVIEVPNPDLVKPIASVLKLHAIGKEHMVGGEGFASKEPRISSAGTVALFEDRGETKKKDPTPDVVAAVESRCAVLVVSAAPVRYLSAELLRFATIRIAVPSFDAVAVGAVIAAITGRHPGRIDESLAKNTTLDLLKLSVRADLGAAESMARLVRLVGDAERDFKKGLTLSEMHGLGPAKEWGLNLAADLREYCAGRRPWHEISSRALLFGPPGVGKTSYCAALARVAGVELLTTSYAEWQAYKEGHLGNVMQAIRNVFAEARRKAPTIVLIDEIDSLPARGTNHWNDAWFNSINNCLLEELNSNDPGVVILAASNHPNRLDPALVRSGRLDRQIEIPLPDVPGLVGIFRSHLGKDVPGEDLLPAALAARGRTGADVERWVREARAQARRSGKPLTVELLVKTVQEGALGLPEDLRLLTASHEAGHAIANIFLGVARPVSLSIDAQGGGETNSIVEELRAHTRADIEQYLISMLAGRAAEAIVSGEVTAGAGGGERSDLAIATRIALRLETVYGLGNFGLAHIPIDPERLLVTDPRLLSAVQATLDRAYAAALDLLRTNRAALDALATALFERSYLDAAEIEGVLQKTPLVRSASHGDLPNAAPGSPENSEGQAGTPKEPDGDVSAVGVKPTAS